MDVHPVEKGTELGDTVNTACNAVIGTCIGVNQILGGSSADALVRKLFVEYDLKNPIGKRETSQTA